MIDGVTLAPGEEFDMNAAIGDRNKDNGWKTATAIKEGTYVQEYGGRSMSGIHHSVQRGIDGRP